METSDSQDYLVTTHANGKAWQVFWDAQAPLALDHPTLWELIETEQGIQARHKTDGRNYTLPPEMFEGTHQMELTPALGEAPVPDATPSPIPLGRTIKLRIKRLRRLRPAFIPDLAAIRALGPADHYISSGIRDLLIDFKPISGPYKGYIDDAKMFQVQASGTQFNVTIFRKGLRFKVQGQPSYALNPGTPTVLTKKDILGGAFIWGSFWWRINSVATPEMLDLDELDQANSDSDSVPLNSLLKSVGAIVAVVFLISRVFFYMDQYQKDHQIKAPVVTEVELKKPKIIPRTEPLEKPKPIPPPAVAKVEKPKPKPKIAKRETPKPLPKSKPAPKLAQRKPLPPKIKPPVARAPLPLPVPRPVAQAKPVMAAPPKVPHPTAPVAQAPDPAVVKAQQKAALAKSLNFLSTGPSKNVAALATVPGAKQSAKYGATGAGGVPASNSVLNKMANQNTGDGVIATKGSRSIASDSGLAGGQRKGLNDVQGKVSLNALYTEGGDADLASAAGGGGISMSGEGKLSDSQIEKTLAKYLQRFQFCYEKALLSDATLAGTIQMQWTIAVGGAVSDARVVKSALNQPQLHACLTRELSKIVFPSPAGGSVTVKKPFSFQSSTL